jgi:hypothetical protein
MIRHWRESTSTSPSGMHLGHDKAVLRDEKPLEEGEEDRRLSTRMFRMKAAFINAAFDNNHVYDRWANIVNATIKKIQKAPHHPSHLKRPELCHWTPNKAIDPQCSGTRPSL